MTKNYKLFMDKLRSVIDLSDIEDAIEVLRDDSNSLKTKLQKVIIARTFENNLNKFKTNQRCPNCDENFYECEV